MCCNIRIILYKSYLIRGAFPGKTEVCRFAARGMRPPFSLVLPKKTGRARSKRKTPLCPNPSLRSGLDRTGVERDGAPKIDSLLPGALESWGTEMVLPRIWGRGSGFRGWSMKGLFFWPALSASLSAAWVAAGKPIQGRQSGSGGKKQVKSVLHPPTHEGSPSRAHDWKFQQIQARAQR